MGVKMDKLKKIWCIILCATIVFLSLGDVTSVYAGQSNNASNPEEYEYYTEIGVTLGYFGYESNESIYCSQILDVATQEDTDETAMMVFDGDETIGMLTKQEIDGNIIYSFIYNNFEELDEIVDEGKEITLVNDDDQLLCVSDDNVKVLIDSNTDNEQEKLNEVFNKVKKQKVKGIKVKKEKLPKDVLFEADEKYEVDFIARQYNSNTSEINNIVTNKFYVNDRYHTAYYQINVPFVKNDKKVINDDGLCWAAVGASLSKYFKKTDYGAFDVYAKLKMRYFNEPDNEPVGIFKWETRMFSMLGLKIETIPNRKMSYNEVIECLSKGRPIDIGVTRYVNREIENAHAIILCGTFACLSDGRYYYVYMDPNVKGYVVNSIISATVTTDYGTTFYYTNGQVNYNNWDNSYIVYK